MTDTSSPGLFREIRIAARPETIFQYFVDPDRMVRWMGTTATLDARPGGPMFVLVAGSHRMSGEYVEVDPPRRVVFTFGWEGEDSVVPPGSSRVEIDLVPEGGETILRFLHTNLPVATQGDHATGWDHYLERLTVAATGGDPGSDPWAADAPSAAATAEVVEA